MSTSAQKRPSRHRVLLRTIEIAAILGVKEATVRQMVWRGTLVFTGDPVVDFRMLAKLDAERTSAPDRPAGT